MLSAVLGFFVPTSTVDAAKVQTSIEVLQKCGSSAEGCNWGDFLTLIQEGIGFMFFLGSLLMVISICYAGWLFISGAGNASTISKAKGIMWNVVLGVIFMFTGWLIVNFIFVKLGVKAGYTLLN
jgi:hypothetical protein